MEHSRVAVVPDDPMPIAVGLEKAQRHTIQYGAGSRKRGVVHRLRCRRLQDAMALIFAAPEMSDHELRHVRAGRGRAPRGPCSKWLKGFAPIRRSNVSARHQRHERSWWRLPEGRMAHVEW